MSALCAVWSANDAASAATVCLSRCVAVGILSLLLQ